MSPSQRDRHTDAYWTSSEQRDLGTRLHEIAAGALGRWSFAVAERGTVASVAPDSLHPAASTIKVPLLLATLADVADGVRSMEDLIVVPERRTAGSGVLDRLGSVTALRLVETLELMVTLSDNTATNMLIDLLGMDTIDARLGEMGLRRTHLWRKMMDSRAAAAGHENVATAGELARLLDHLAGGRLLPPEMTTTALAVLGRQQSSSRIPAHLPPGVHCLHKTGELAGVCHDVGVLCFAERSVSFAALGSELPGVAEGGNGTGPAATVIATAARAVIDVARGG